MSEIIKNRKEILFLYDLADGNPNGDPADENKPRIDEESGINIVTDVRLKRTIRDYLHDVENYELFVRQIADDAGLLQDAKARARDFLPKDLDLQSKTFQEAIKIIDNTILKECIDVRLFGATIPIELTLKKKEKGSITHTGPVQFKMGRSLHRVKLTYIKGTGAFASEAGKKQQTFREEWILPYTLIAFYGIINENRADETHLTEDDVKALYKGIWNGTKGLISRSKVGQVSRLLLVVTYKKPNFHIGELDKLISLTHEKASDEEIRDIGQVTLHADSLIKQLFDNKENIEKIDIMMDERLPLVDETDAAIDDLVTYLKGKGLTVAQLSF